MARRFESALRSRDSHFKAVSYPAGSLDKVLGGGRRTNLGSSSLEERKPAIEMRPIDRQTHMHTHRLPVITAGHQRD